jgi:UDPglucose--hexose-1-phosphate uridylyltransferase
MIDQRIQQLINQAIAAHLMEPEDEIYARNQILSLLHLVEFKECDAESNLDIPDLLDQLVEYL